MIRTARGARRRAVLVDRGVLDRAAVPVLPALPGRSSSSAARTSLVRLGLTDLEAGYAVSQLHGHVGDRLRVTYTLRNGSRIPKPWLEVHNPTTLPGGLPGRAISLGGRSERSWLIRAPLTRRGHFRIEPLHIRTGDPFGFFEASATVGQGVSVVVYPRLEPLPAWRLPAASLEGSHASPERTLQTTPLARPSGRTRRATA